MKLYAPCYAETTGRPGVPLVSRSLGNFIGLSGSPTDPVPNHSCVSKIYKRLPEEVFNEVFRFILSPATHKGLLWGKALGIDSTTISANASMARKVRKDSGKGWKDDTKKLASQAGLEDPTDDELRQFHRNRPGKKVSNDDWENLNDPDATITRMKDGTTRMAYKAEEQPAARVANRETKRRPQGWPAAAGES